jgi:hypothetical protein
MPLYAYPTGQEKPSEITPLPGNMVRPTFEKLYGFDVPQADVVDGAIFTELSEPLTTELNEILLFEPTA